MRNHIELRPNLTREEKFHVSMAAPGTWNSTNGRVLKIKEMEDTHLENAIKVLEGKGVSSAAKHMAAQLGKKESELEPEKTQLETEEDLIASMEAKLTGVPMGIINKYIELTAERDARMEEGKWDPYRPRVGPNYPRVRRR